MGAGTLISQAFGAKDLKMCYVYRNRQMFLSTCIYLLLCIPMLFIRSIYSLMGQHPEISDYAAKYVWIVLPSLYFFVMSQSYAMFTGNQKVTWISTTATITGCAVHFVLVILLVDILDFGFTGICIATNIHFMTRFSINMGMVEFTNIF